MATDQSVAEKFDPLSKAHFTNPFELYKRYRQEDPVHWGAATTSSVSGTWYLFSHPHVAEALKDSRLVSDRMNLMPDEVRRTYQAAAESSYFMQLASSFLVSMDPPDHTRLRSLISQAFTPQVVADLRGEIETIAHSLLEENLINNEIEVVKSFAGPLPLKVIASMLGIEIKDYEEFSRCSADLSATIESSSPEVIGKAIAASDILVPLLKDLIEDRRKHPRNDLISNLVRAEVDRQLLNENEIVATCMLLLVAGHETTVNLIANGFLALLQFSDQFDLLKENPQLMPNAIEEMLRFDPPGRIATRWAAETFEIGGKTIACGDKVALLVASANRDESVFANAETLDIRRNASAHLSFGKGIHYCLGAPLARLEGQIAFHTLISRLPKPRLLHETFEWHERANIRGLKALKIAAG
jgi:cytochrome P450 StaP